MFKIRLGIPEVQGDITIVGIEPHPEDKKRFGYSKVRLSSEPE